MFGALSRQAGRFARGIARQPKTGGVRQSSHHATETYPGENLPFGIENPYKLTLYFTLFFGSAFGTPFLIVRHQLLKQ